MAVISDGDFRQTRVSKDEAIVSSADWFNMHNLDIAGEAGDVVVATKWTGEVCKGFHNYGASTATIKVYTVQAPSTEITLSLSAGGFTGKLPAIETIVQSGTSDDLVVFTQRQA